LRPIVAGAGILYVVDGGVPYGPEYEAEMEILRWTGAPSMAIINPIEKSNHIEQWQAALSQFFRVVRVIDAVAADFATRRELLLAFGELETSWRAPIEEAVDALDEARRTQKRFAAREIAEFISNSLSLVVERKLDRDQDPTQFREALEAEYKSRLQRLESDHRRAVQRIYEHHILEADVADLVLLEQDLFSEGTWLAFGLRRRDLVTAGAASGAATGVVVDAALHGASLLLGMVAGAAIGGVLGWLGADRLAELKVVNQPLGGNLVRFGPSKNLQFPFVLLGRARLHWSLVAGRTHAMRVPIEFGAETATRLPLEPGSRKELEKSFARLRKPGLEAAKTVEAVDELQHVIERVMDEAGLLPGENAIQQRSA
jgi:hypothetical protein